MLIIAALLAAVASPAPAMGAADAHGAIATPPHSAGGIDVTVARTPAENAAETILFRVVDAGIVMLVLSFALCLMRVVRGPTLIDRGIATDTITLHVVGLAILLTIGLRSLLYFDAVLIFAILGFATTVAFAQFVGRRRAV
jgi:multicomponent K+:H+ antiporter subunit F